MDVASLDYCVYEVKRLFSEAGYTVYDIYDMDSKKITKLNSTEYPVVCIGRGIEEINNEDSPVGFIDAEANIDINIVFNTGEENLRADSDNMLREVKNIIYGNRNNCAWKDIVITDNYVAQVQSASVHSSVYGGLNINCLVSYREESVVEDYWLSDGAILYSGTQVVV